MNIGWIEKFDISGKIADRGLTELIGVRSEDCVLIDPTEEGENCTETPIILSSGGSILNDKVFPHIFPDNAIECKLWGFGVCFSTIVGQISDRYHDSPYLQRLQQPVGVRDEFTQSVLKECKIESSMVGFTAYHIPFIQYHRKGYVVFSPTASMPKEDQIQLRRYIEIDNGKPIILVSHDEAVDDLAVSLKESKLIDDFVSSEADLDEIIAAYVSADGVYTGKCQAAALAASHGVPVCFYVDNVVNVRYHGIRSIGIPAISLSGASQPHLHYANRRLVENLKMNMISYADSFKDAFS